MLPVVSMLLLMFLGAILMFIILLQKGRGGGLAGAFGGLGGQSAFGTKAGDVFTKITVVIAILWVVTAGMSGFALRSGAAPKFQSDPPEQPAAQSTEPPVKTAPADGTAGATTDEKAALGEGAASETPPSDSTAAPTDSGTKAAEPTTPATDTPEGDKAAPESETGAGEPNQP